MSRYLSVALGVVCLLALPALAGENHNAGLGLSAPHLVTKSFSAGQVEFEVLADPRVDVERLVAGLDLSKSASAQSISDRVNQKRELLYPDEEIILSIRPPQDALEPVLEEKVGLVNAIYWWNNNNCSTCFWFAQYSGTVATMNTFVRSGAYNIYDKVGSSGAWVFRYRVAAGNSATRYSFGPNVLRGFKGASAGVASRADIVMYFFN